MREYRPGGWWRADPLPICERPEPRRVDPELAAWQVAMGEARDRAAEQWLAGDTTGALRPLCAAGVFWDDCGVAYRRADWDGGSPARRCKIRLAGNHARVKHGRARMKWRVARIVHMLLSDPEG